MGYKEVWPVDGGYITEKNLFSPGPMHQRRFDIVKNLTGKIKTGDVFVRLDNFNFYGLPFTKLVAKLTKSKFSHAAVALVEDTDIYLVEVSDQGTVKLRLCDWVDYILNNNFSVYRLKTLTPEVENNLGAVAKKFLEEDDDYDFTFGDVGNKYYCTESVNYIYNQCGFEFPSMYLKDFLNPLNYWAITIGNWIVKKLTSMGLDTNKKFYFVGNEKIGMLSADFIELVEEVSFD